MEEIRHDETAIVEVVRQYAEAMAAERKNRAQRPAGVLWEKYRPALYKICQEHRLRPDEHAVSLFAAVLEACQSYDVEKGSFEAWWRVLVRQEAQKIVGETTGGRSWGRVSRYAHAAEADLTQKLRREPTREEVQEEVASRTQAWGEQRVRESALERGETLTEEEIQAKAAAKLRKDGTSGALRDLDTVMARTAPALSLNAPVSESGNTLLDTLGVDSDDAPAAWLDIVHTMWTKTELYIVESRNRDRRETSWRTIADMLGVDDWTEVRKSWELARSKPVLPHAHWAYLSLSSDQFDPPVEEQTDGALERLRRRTQGAARTAAATLV